MKQFVVIYQTKSILNIDRREYDGILYFVVCGEKYVTGSV